MECLAEFTEVPESGNAVNTRKAESIGQADAMSPEEQAEADPPHLHLVF